MDPMKSHGKVAGYVKPQRHFFLLSRGGIGLCKFIQNRLGLNESKELGLIYLAGRLDIIKVSITKGLEYKRFVFLEDHEVHLYPH
jgi:hypothetical protein